METHVNDLKALKRLARGVLRRGLDDLTYAPDHVEVKELVEMTRAEAREWFKSDSVEWGSFRHICAVLQRDPTKMLREGSLLAKLLAND